jgi:S1-C subfamily serine protease
MSHIADTHLPMGRPSRMGARLALAALFAVLCLSPSTTARGQGFDKAVLDRVKDATVYIKIRVNGQIVSAGSGFVIQSTPSTALVMTNRHVAVHGDDDDDEPGNSKVKPEISVVFRSGTATEQEIQAKLLTFDHRPVPDLAILEIKGLRQPTTAISAEKMANESEFFETMTAYSLGFPLGGMISGGKLDTNPAVTVNAMTISSFRRGEANRLERIQFAGSMIQGNSGGPIVNEKGQLVGVVVERLNGENVGRAIPPSVVATFLAGDVDITYGQLISRSGNTAKFAIGGRMVDPFGKIRSMSARYILQSALPNPPKIDAQGHYPIMPGSKDIKLEMRASATITGLPVADAAGYGQLDLPITTPGDRKLYFQIVVTDSFGRNIGGKPTPTTIPDKPELGLHDLDTHQRQRAAATLAKWSCEVNKGVGVKMKHDPGLTTISLPGGVAFNNMPKENLFNAPCALVRVEGDFVAKVEILNSFDPGDEGVILPSGKKFPSSFQSTGLLIWQDENNFVRFERSKASDGQIGYKNQVLVEVYKKGKVASYHYIDVPLAPIALVAIRKGGSIQLLFAMPPQQLAVFEEMAINFENEVLVGVAAANLSMRKFEAKLKEFQLTNLNGGEIAAKPVPMTNLVESGIEKLDNGTVVYEGARLKVLRPQNAPVSKQPMAKTDKGEWSGDRMLLWSNEKKTSTLTLELPVEAAGKYEVKARFTQGPDCAIAKVDIDGKALYKDATIDLYALEVQPKLYSMGTCTLAQGPRKVTITIFNKNPKSNGYHIGLDDIQLIPAK